MHHIIRPLVEGPPGPLRSLPLGTGCIALWKGRGPVYAFDGPHGTFAEIQGPGSYIYALGRGAEQTILVPTIRGLVYRYDMDGRLVETVTLENPMHLLAVAQLPDGRYLACIGDRVFEWGVTPYFALFDRAGKFQQLVMQRQISEPPFFEVLPWGDVLLKDEIQFQLIAIGKRPSVINLGFQVVWRIPNGHDPLQSAFFGMHPSSDVVAYSKAGEEVARRTVAIETNRPPFIAHDNCFAILDTALNVHTFDLDTLSESSVQRLSLNAFERRSADVEHYDYRQMPYNFPELFQLGKDQYLCMVGTQPVAFILNAAFEQTGMITLFEGGTLERICHLDNENFIAIDHSGNAALLEFC